MERHDLQLPEHPDARDRSPAVADRAVDAIVERIRDAGPAFVVVRADTTIHFATKAAERLTGRALTSLRLADYLDEVGQTDLAAAVQSGGRWSRLVRSPSCVDGAIECNLLHAAAAPTPGGDLFVITMSELADVPQRILELEASQQRSLALLEAMPDLLFRVSRQLTFLDYRDPTARGLGVAPEAFLGKRLDEFLPPEIVSLVEPNLAEALATGETVTYASHYDYEDGRHTFDNRVVKSGDDEVVLICRDTTEQTRAVQELQLNQARFQRIVEHSREYTTITDRQGLMTFVSAGIQRILGFTPDELLGTPFMGLVHSDDFSTVMAVVERQRIASDDRPLRLRLRRKDGGSRIIEATTKALFDDELIGGMLTHCRDITDYVGVQENLRDSLSRLDAIVDTAAEGILTIDAAGTVLSMNRAAKKMFRLGEDIEGSTVESLFAEITCARVVAAMRRAVGGRPGALASLPSELECLRSDGSVFPVSVSMSILERDGGLTFVAIVRDDSERRALEHQLEYQATHDVLTGLPNRNLFMANLERALRRSVAKNHYVAVLFLDLDRFKIVNDSLGHAAGDRLLCAVAGRLTGALRGDATIARFGGDEFLVLCPGLNHAHEAIPIADRVLETLRESISIGGEHSEDIFVNASVGIAVYRPDFGTIEPEVMVRNADIALYRAKELGRNRFEVFDWLDATRNQNRLAIETALRHALPRNELLVHYQPIQAIDSGVFSGTEALVRWNREGNLVPPGRFIPIAEESDLIVDIGLWVLREACTQTAIWRKLEGMQDLSVAVNVSVRQLDRRDFPDVVRAVLAETGLDPGALTLEITETCLVHDDDGTLNRLHDLKATGVNIAIDDFGTGYSSLGYLTHLPVDVIKLDRIFTSQLEHDRHTNAIVRTIITLAHTLGMTVVAEGVETEGQLHALQQLSCDTAQGFLLARPASSDAVSEFLAQSQLRLAR